MMEPEARASVEEMRTRFDTFSEEVREALLWGSTDAALELARARTATDSEATVVAAVAAYLAGDFPLAIEWSQDVLGRTPGAEYRNAWYTPRVILGASLAKVGRHEEAEVLLTPLVADYTARLAAGATAWRYAWTIAVSAAALGQTQESLSWLERAYALGFRNVRQMQLDPSLTLVRRDPQFEAVEARIVADLAEARAAAVR